MRISFFSNFLNHHQLPFCKELIENLGDNFIFIATERTPEDRLAMGYEDMNEKYSFVLSTYSSEENKKRALQIAYESDVVIFGDAPEFYLKERLKANRLTFRFRERVFRKGYYSALDPRVIKSMLMNHTRYRHKNFRLLCASGYTACDMSLFGAYPNKMYKWGYFPETRQYDIKKFMREKEKKKIYILWVGRLLRLKHPEHAIHVAKFLKGKNIQFQLTIIGEGEMRDMITSQISEEGLQNNVELIGFMSPDKVREYMEEADIFLFTSDYGEGWGAVLNEAMNSGCAVVASHAIGSVPFLLQHEKNGLIYESGNIKDLNKKVFELCRDLTLREKIGTCAYKTVTEQWSAKKAAENFLALCISILSGKEILIESGPGSIAKVIGQNKMYKYLTLMRDDEKNEDFK